MGWKIWGQRKKLEKGESLELLSSIEENLHKLDDKLQEVDKQLDNNEDLIQKSIRLQYKSYQEFLNKLDQTNERIDKTINYSKKYIEVKQDKDNLIEEKNYLLGKNIQWLDDIDLICDKIRGQDLEFWIQLLKNWQNQILESLETLNIYEIDILGKSFNYEVAESVSTKEKEDNKEYLPYEVVDVLQRGFIFKDGTLLRKAKVITIEEEEGKKDYE